MGDGVLAYFGFPQAHEDDAEQAVRCALELIEAVPKLRPYHDVALAVRVGIATGVVVVGDILGEGAAQEQGVVGDTPNLAARLQALAEPGQVVISHSTRRLTAGLFEYGNLGRVTLKGLPPEQVWQVLGVSGVQSRFEAHHEAGLTPLIGRDEEIELLLRRWRQAASGEGHVVLVSGEPGIGKSRLIAELQQRVASEPHAWLRYFCSPNHQDSALHPTIAQLERAAGFQRADTPQLKLDKLVALLGVASGHDNDLQLLAELLSIPTGDRYAPLNLSPQQKKEKTFLMLLAQLEALARQYPVVMVYEDVHWIDPSSRELLDRAVGRVPGVPVLLVITFRPEFQSDWTAQPHVTSMALNRLGRSEGIKLVGSIAGNALPDEVVADIVERTDGVPLFVEEVTKAVVEAGSSDESMARQAASSVPHPALGVPATLHASLIARLDRIGAVAREIAQIGAVIGREFDYELLEAVAKRPEADLKTALQRLTEAELMFQRGAIPQAAFLFKHALVRDTAYGSLLRGQRRELHARVSEEIERNFPDVGERQPEVLARHLTEAGHTEQAIEQWLKAGQHAAARSAHLEAIAHLHRGLELLSLKPAWPRRVQVESDLQLALGVSFFSTKGLSSAEAAAAYERARELCENSGDSARLFTALWGLWHSHNSSARMEQSRRLCLRLLSLTEKQADAGLRLQAHHTAWTTFFVRGDPLLSLRHGEEGLRLYEPQMHQSHVLLYGGHDPNLCGLSITACDNWMLGRSDTALKCAENALRLADELAHPLSTNMALQWLALLHHLRREPQIAVARIAAAEVLSAEHGLSLWTNTRILRAIALVKDQAEVAVAQVREGLAIGQAGGAWGPYYLYVLAEALSTVGDTQGALAAVVQALSMAQASGERWWEAELCRQMGELRRSRAQDEESAPWFQRALVVSREQNAKSLELRAAMSLARLWRDQGKRSKALDLLAPVYGWFTEGHDTLDLKEARMLLDQIE
jgi:predicted ATPase